MAHYVSIIDGMTNATDKDLSNLAVAFVTKTGGVVGGSDYQVQAQGTPNNTVLIGTGRAYVPTSDGSMMYSTHMDATQNVTISPNSSGNARIDSIVLYLDLSVSVDASADNVAKFYDVQGTPGASPVAPTSAQILTAIGSSNPYIVLANIAVANGFISINSGNITDQRAYAKISGGDTVFQSAFANFVQSGLTIPTSATLSATSVAGTIYYNGVAISVASDGGHTYTASNDCYVDVSNAGAYTYNTVANGAAAPALTANSIRIAKVVTSGTAVTGVTQDGLDSLGNVIYPSNPTITPTHAFTTLEQVTTPANPSSGYNKVYTKSDGNLYILNSSGTETIIGSSGPGADGWISTPDTFAYASASSFTISGVNRTAVYTKGTRVKFTNNTVTYYGVVISSSFSTNTTVNLAPNNDYSIANSAITAPYYSYEENPQGYPTIFNYTPTYGASGSMTFTSVTTTTAQFKIDGTMATIYVYAAGTTGGTASYGLRFSLPVTSSNRYSLFGTGLGNTTTNSTQQLAVGNYNYNSTTSGEVCRYDVGNWALGSVDFNIGAQYFI